ncbi:hypothetical protein ACLMJK_004700 [Lecanora helva]
MAKQSTELGSIPFDLTITDRENLAGGDENFQPQGWEDLKVIIAANNLSILKRKPSDLFRYIQWTNQTKAAYGSITNFVLKQRLFWEPCAGLDAESGPTFACRSSTPFVDGDDYKILLNDWPYGLSPNITHLIVWSKVRLAEQKPEGYLTSESNMLVTDFVKRTFINKLAAEGVSDAEDKVLWFRNWTGLQSVKGLEHVHVLVRDAPKGVLEHWTNGNEV